jgi:hypothetical protein
MTTVGTWRMIASPAALEMPSSARSILQSSSCGSGSALKRRLASSPRKLPARAS